MRIQRDTDPSKPFKPSEGLETTSSKSLDPEHQEHHGVKINSIKSIIYSNCYIVIRREKKNRLGMSKMYRIKDGMAVDESAFAMLRALNECLESHSDYIKSLRSKKQYQTFIESLIELLLKDRQGRDMFLAYGGRVDCIQTDKDGRVIGFWMY